MCKFHVLHTNPASFAEAKFKIKKITHRKYIYSTCDCNECYHPVNESYHSVNESYPVDASYHEYGSTTM